MIKLICPHCMKPVPVADDFSGREVTCPSCQKTFDAPARYNPAVLSEPAPPPRPEPSAPPPVPTPALAVAPAPVARPEQAPMPAMVPTDRPLPPPGMVPPTPPVPPPPPAAPTMPAGYTKSIGITISPRVVAWLPAILLTILFVCTFFPWVGSYLGGTAVHSQSPWRAMFASVSRNFALEGNMPGAGAWLDKVTSDAGLMVPFMLCLLAALGFAWTDRGFHSLDPRKIPPLAKLWPWHKTIIGSLAGLAFLFMAIQVSNGFGMERAIRKMVRENPELAKAREEAGNSPAKLAAVENREDAELAKYNLERTWWQDLGLSCNLIAVLAVFLSIRLDRRGDKPPPKILLHY